LGQKHQKGITLHEDIVELLETIAKDEDRSVAGLTKLCILYVFGNKAERKKAQKILDTMNWRSKN